jgi:hypothetical protein
MNNENWDYDKMNELLDLTDDNPTEDLTETEINGLDEDNETEQEQKPQGFSKNPWTKLTLIALVAGLGFGTVGFFLANIPTTGNSTSAERLNSEKEEEEIEIRSNEEELKAQLAVARQERQMIELGERMNNELPNVVIEKPKKIPEPEIIVESPPLISPIHEAPPPVYQPPTPKSNPPTPKPNPPPQHSLNDWLALAGMGSYGGGVVNSEQSQQPEQPPPRQIINQPTVQPVVNTQPRINLLAQSNPQNNLSREEQRLMGRTFLRAGTRVKAEIVNSMIAVEGESPFLAVITSEPIEVDGRIVIPAGTEIIFESGVHSSGLVVANAISLFMDSTEIELPSQVLQLRTGEGQPLMASRQNNPRGEILRRDATGFALGALGKVGEITNRARTTSTFTGVTGTGSTSTFNEPNYTGAVLEGGFNPLARQWEQRNQDAIKQLQNQGVVWAIPPGQSVEIIIARSFSL